VHVRLSDPTLDSFDNNEGAKALPQHCCAGPSGAVTMKKRLTLLLLIALLLSLLTLPGRNKRRRHESFI